MIGFSTAPWIAETLATGIVACVIDGLAAAMIAWILLRVFGRTDSGTRFAVWFSTLLIILFLPFLSSLRGLPASTGFSPSAPLMTVSSSWAVIISMGWSIAATIGLVRIGRGFMRLRGLRKACRVVELSALDPDLRSVIETTGRVATICVSEQVVVPTAIGFLKPMVILPSWTLQELSAAELKPILLHEMAHVKRWDDWTNLLQKVVQALVFFHPIVWWIESRLSLEREMACDDIVLARRVDARTYARSLLTIAEKSFAHRGLSLAQAAVTRMRETSVRVAQILDSSRPRVKMGWSALSAVFTIAAMSTVLALPKIPEVISFRDNVPVSTVSEVARPSGSLQLASVARASHEQPGPPLARGARTAKHSIHKTVETTEPVVPAVIEASFSKLGQRSAADKNNTTVGTSRTVFVVMQTRQSSDINSSVVTIDVWRVTLYRMGPNYSSTPLKKI